MTDETEQKILNAALKVFSEEGYKGATTLAIAEESGFSEKTLFRKFKTKKNLFNSIMSKNNEKIRKDFESMVVDTKFKDSKDFLEVLIKNLAKLTYDNYEYLDIALNEYSRLSEVPAAQEIAHHLSQYIEKNVSSKEIDYPVFAASILSYIFFLVGDKYRRRIFIDYEEAIEKYVNNLTICIR